MMLDPRPAYTGRRVRLGGRGVKGDVAERDETDGSFETDLRASSG
ncbi:hypothetical protein FHS85_002723 [Rhodoligotrophos appendicifer]|nr:hypothetical protein [Rhodoligotrophos appendicifer]